MNPDQHRNALNRHDRLHWYEIESILGQGGFGITYLARDTNLDQLVAIKEYLPTEFSTRDEANTVQPISEKHTEIFDWGKKRFLEEAKTLAQFRHPNVIRVSSFFENNNTGYMVMDYEEGTDLAALIKAGEKFDQGRILDLLLPILDGLGQIHAQGFIHRDIKPANIFIRTDGSPVLIDFGSARQAIGGQTKTMTSLVTPGFAPFEQYHDAEGKQGPWTDIYSLGATCYSLITGKPPIDALKRGMARIDHSIDAYLHLTDLNAGEKYSRHLLQAIDYALEFRESDRPQDVAAWRATLLGEAPVPQGSTPTDDAAAEPASDGNTLVVTRPGEKTRAAAADAVTEPVTGPDAPTVPATAPPAAAAPENAPAAAPRAPASGQRRGRGAMIGVVLLAVVLLGLGAIYQLRQPQPAAPDIPPAAGTGAENGQAEAARLAVEKEALRLEQARLAAEKAKLKAEQARIEAEKQLQEERARKAATAEALRQEQARLAAGKAKLEQDQARLAAEKQRQAELARQQAADEKRRLELARQQAEAEKRQQELARQAEAEKRRQELEKQAQAQRRQQEQAASASLNNGSADDPNDQSTPSDPFADVSGTYRPDDGFEEVKLQQSGNRIRGTIGDKGSTLEGRREGNRITFAFNYSRTGYGFRDGFGQFTISADGKRLSGSRSGGGFPPESSRNLNRKAGN